MAVGHARRSSTSSALPIVAFARGGAGKDAAAIVNDGLRSWQERRVCYRGREPGAGPWATASEILVTHTPPPPKILPRNNSVDGFALPLRHSRIESNEAQSAYATNISSTYFRPLAPRKGASKSCRSASVTGAAGI